MSEEVEEDGMVEEIDFDDVEEELDDDSTGKKGKPDSFTSIIADFFVGVNYKLILMLFLIYVFIMSDMFIDKVLSKMEGTVRNNHDLTSKGTMVNGILMILLYMTADMLIRNQII